MRSLLVICGLLLILLSGSVMAQSGPLPDANIFDSPPPPPPQAFYGDATFCRMPAPIGTIVEARGTNVKITSTNPIVTTVTGKYGGPTLSEIKLGVQGWIENGTPIFFYMNNQLAQVSVNGTTWGSSVGFVSGTVTRLHLRVLRCNYVPLVMQ